MRQSLWLCFYLHGLPIDQLGLNSSIAAIAEKQRIVFVSDPARAAGIQPDMRLATAYALQSDITIVERRPDREAEALEQLSQWAYQFTPTVQTYKHFSVVLEIGGSLFLFKGLKQLLRQIQEGLQQQGYRYSAGMAHTIEAAWLFSRYRADHKAPPPLPEIDDFNPPSAEFWLKRLHPLPLTCLDIPEKPLRQLHNMGFRKLGELMHLPQPELGRRFGKGLLDLLAAIGGKRVQAVADLKPPQAFTAHLDFPNGLSKIDELREPMQDLLSQLLHFLHKQQLYIQELEWQFFYFRKPADRLLIHTSPANNSLSALLTLTQLKLERLKLKEPVESLALNSQCFTAATPSSGDLFPELSHPSNQLKDYQRLLDKLLTRLGNEALSSLRLADEHLPELQQQGIPIGKDFIADLKPLAPAPADFSTPAQLPLWLAAEAVSIADPTAQAGPIRLIYGPQRIDSHWWQERQQRDYYIAHHQSGSYCWVFQDRQSQRWFLQGWYA